MKTRASLAFLCFIAASGCGRLSATNQETSTAVSGSSGKSAMTAAPEHADSSPLRDSYFNCANTSDGATWNIQSCIEKEFAYQDAKLNSIYRNLMERLPIAERQVLRDEERRWLSDKEATCKWDARSEGQAQRINANVCSLKETAERAARLEKELFRLGRP